ncbi:Putative F-box/LRR-repeat protein At5g02930 [Linum grandiflorum]
MATDSTRGSKKQARDFPKVDHISTLTEELLVEILSLLSLKEAARTSILSKRWVDLWKLLPNLELDYGSMLNEKLVEKKTYIQLVSKVLAQHKGPKVNNLRICLQLTSTSNSNGDIERWVEFAISKGVERLALDFNRGPPRANYDSEFDEYDDYGELKGFSQSGVLLGLSNIRFFRALHLRSVQLTDAIFNHLVLNCRLLEKLVIDRCDGLVKVKLAALASSPLLSLKHFEIIRCPFVNEIEINAPNLVSFGYEGGKVDLKVVNTSSLTEMDLRVNDRSNYTELGIEYVSSFDLLRQHRTKFVQLEILTIAIEFCGWRDVIRSFNGEFPFLKHLTVYFESLGDLDDKYDRLVPLINASPSLTRLSLKCIYGISPLKPGPCYVKSDGGSWEDLRPSIRVLEIDGFDTFSSDPFLDYVLHHFIMLEKLVINYLKEDNLTPREALNHEARVAKSISDWKSAFPSTVEFVATF